MEKDTVPPEASGIAVTDQIKNDSAESIVKACPPEMISALSSSVKIDVLESTDGINERTSIEATNKETADPVQTGRDKLIQSYLDSENNRLKQQRPLLNKILDFTKFQIIISNIVILIITVAVVCCYAFSDSGKNELSHLFDFLKYYVGAVLVEFVGMIFFITKNVFSSSNTKIIEKMLDTNSKEKNNN